MAEYGIPYMGSKGSIVNDLIRIFPKADHFYDLFGGGFSVTHGMLSRRSKDYKHFHFNEIRNGICDLIKDAIDGKYNYNVFKPPWVSREDFFKNLDTDPMIKILWSFGNSGSTYMFSKEIEPYKKSMHNAIVFNEFDDLAIQVMGCSSFREGYDIKSRRLLLRNRIEFYRKTTVPEFLYSFLKEKELEVLKRNKQLQQLQQLQQLEQLERLEQLQQLEQLQRLEQLQQLERLNTLDKLNYYNLSYEQVSIKENSIIYCDPPYANTGEYDGGFDHKTFFDWADNQVSPVFISEYNIPDKRFTEIWNIKKRSKMSAKKILNIKIEKLYVNQAGLKALKK